MLLSRNGGRYKWPVALRSRPGGGVWRFLCTQSLLESINLSENAYNTQFKRKDQTHSFQRAVRTHTLFYGFPIIPGVEYTGETPYPVLELQLSFLPVDSSSESACVLNDNWRLCYLQMCLFRNESEIIPHYQTHVGCRMFGLQGTPKINVRSEPKQE